jgi:hypothetical protein
MKYAEYQVWFHVFNNVVISMARSSFNSDEINTRANAVATYAVNRFSTIEDAPAVPQVDLQGIVDSVIKNAGKK